MYIGRVCPLVHKENQVPFQEPFACREMTCRFQIEGVCAIIGAFYDSQDIGRRLSEIEKRLGIVNKSSF